MKNYINCTPTASQLDFSISVSLRKKLKNKLPNTLANNLAGVILSNNPVFFTSLKENNDAEGLKIYNEFIDEIAKIAFTKSAILSGLQKNIKAGAFIEKLMGSEDILIQEIHDEINKISNTSSITSEIESYNTIQEPIDDNIGTELDMSSSESEIGITRIIKPIDEIATLKYSPISLINKNNLDLTKITDHYFSDSLELVDEFKDFFKGTYLNSIIDSDVDADVHFRQVGAAMKHALEEFELWSEGSELSLLDNIANYLDVHNENVGARGQEYKDEWLKGIRKGYYAKLALEYLDNIALELLPGLDFKLSKVRDTKSTIVFSASMAHSDAYSSMNRFIQDFILETKVLEVSTDKLLDNNIIETKSKLKVNDLNFSFLTTSGLDFTNEENFVSHFNKTLSELPNGQAKDILSTLYYRFFAPDAYTVDGEKRYSLLGIIKNDKTLSAHDKQALKDIAVNIFSKISGSTVNESNVMINNKTTLTNHLNADATAQLLTSFKNSLISTKEGNVESLDGAVIGKINFNLTESNDEIELSIGDTGSRKLIKISLKEEDYSTNRLFIKSKNVLSIGENVAILKLLLKETTLFKDKTLKEYVKNNRENSYELTNLIVNIAWVLKSKANPTLINKLIEDSKSNLLQRVSFDNSLPSLKDILFDALDKGYSKGDKESSQLVPKLTMASKVMSLDSKQTRINIANDIIGTTTKVNFLSNPKSHVREVHKLIKAGLKPVLHRNLFSKLNPAMVITDYYELEGVKENNKGKHFTELEPNEQDHFLISAFVSRAVTTNFKETVLFTTHPSDKSNIKAPNIKILSKALEYMPTYNDNGFMKLNEDALRDQMTSVFKNYHEDQAESIITLWKAELIKLNTDGKLNNPELIFELTNIKNINQLNDFANKYKIPVGLFEGSNLTTELHYVQNKGVVNHAGINKVFLDKYNIWCSKNTELSKNEIKKMKGEFYRALRTNKTLINNKLTLPLDYETSKALKNRFPSNTVTSMLTSYFYHGAIARHEVNNLSGASLYQFKNDEGKSEEFIKNTAEKIYESRLKSFDDKKKYLTAEEKVKLLAEIEHDVRMSKLYSNMFMNQIKRNAILTSVIEKPFLASKFWKGLYLEEKAFSAVIKDRKVFVELLGALKHDLDQESTDAVCFVLSFFKRKMNNSIGNQYSSNFEENAPLKDITISKDALTNATTMQKKASFEITSDLLRSGSPKIHFLFKKMLNSVKFENPASVNGSTCSSVYDVFLSFGGWADLDAAYIATGDWLGENTEYRNQYIELSVFQSGEKTGSSNINTFSILDEGETPLNYKEINMLGHGNILKSGHNPDTTDTEDPAKVSMLTQLINAMGLEGATRELSNELFNSLEQLSMSELQKFTENNYYRALDVLDTLVSQPEQVEIIGIKKISTINGLIVKSKLNKISEEEVVILNSFIKEFKAEEKAREILFKKITVDALATREVYGPGTTEVNSENITWGSLQLRAVAKSALASHLNDLTVRAKFSGGQHVVATAFEMLQVFTSKNGMRMSRKSYNNHSPKDTLITLENKSLYTYTDLVTVNGSAKLMAFGDIEHLIGTATIKGVNLSDSKNISELRFMKYFKLDANNKEIFFGEKGSETELLFNSLKDEKNDEKRRELEHEIQATLSIEGWKATATEFFTPMMHASAYNLSKGTDIPDIVGDVNLNTEEGLEQGIKNSKVFFRNNFIRITQDTVLFKKYLGKKDPKIAILNLFKTKKGLANINLIFDENNKLDVNKTIAKLKRSVKEVDDNELVEQYLQDVETVLNSVDPNSTDFTNTLKTLGSIADTKFELAIELFSSIQADNFYKVLLFVTGRIPSQGKQSGTAGVTVGFINDTKNTFYTCVEFTKLTGQDHDNDKLNTINVAVDNFGRVYDYSKYLDVDGKLSIRQITSVKENLIESIKEKYKKLSDKEIAEKLKKAIDREHNYLINAIKNRNLDLVTAIYMSPKNAIESQSPISMDSTEKATKKIGNLLEEFDSSENETGNITMESYQPYNIAQASNVTQTVIVGKGVVGISAVAMKTYEAIFKAYSNDQEQDFTLFRNTFEKLPFTGSYIEMYQSKYQLEKYYKTKNALGETNGIKVFRINPTNGKVEVKVSDRVANLHSINFKRSKDLAIQAIGDTIKEKYKHLDENSNQYAIQLEKELRLHIDAENITTQQAWEYISEILSAATDNAKEFILGRIGADLNTSGIILNILILGHDLETAIELVTDPQVQKLFELSAKTKAITYKQKQISIKSAFETYLKSEISSYKFNTRVSTSESEIKHKENKLKFLQEENINSINLKNEGFKSLSDLKFNEPSIVNIRPGSTEEANINAEFYSFSENKTIRTIPKFKNLSNFQRSSKTPDAALNKIIATVKNNDTTILVQGKNGTDAEITALSVAQKYNKTVYIFNHSGELVNHINGCNIPLIKGESYSMIGEFNQDIIDNILNNNNNLYETNEAGVNKLDISYSELLAGTEDELISKQEFVGKVFDEVVLDKPRQLYQFIIASAESRLANSIYGINQGLKINHWEESLSLFNISEALNISRTDLPKYIDLLINDPDKVLKEQAKNLKKGEGDMNYSFYNNIYILSQNRHFLSYIKAQLTSHEEELKNNNISNIINFLVNGIDLNNTDQLEEEATDNESNAEYMGVDQFRYEKNYKAIVDIVYNFSIFKLYNRKNIPNDQKNIKISTKNFNYEFDLSDTTGRQNFIYSFPEIVSELKALHPALNKNAFINQLYNDNIVDLYNRKEVKIIKTGNLSEKESHELGLLKSSLEQLGQDDQPSEIKDLYNAFLHYNLILSKGGNDKYSYAALISPDKNISKYYNETIRDLKIDDFSTVLESLGPLKTLLAPEAIPLLSTAYSEYKNFEQMMDEIENGQGKDEEDGNVIKQKDKTNKKLNFFYTPKVKNLPKVYRSKEYPDLVFTSLKDHTGEPRKMQITPRALDKTVLYNFTDYAFGALEKTGWQIGKTVRIDENRNGQVAYPIQSSSPQSYAVSYNGNWEIILRSVLQDLNPDMVFEGPRVEKRTIYDKPLSSINNYELANLQSNIQNYIDGVSYVTSDQKPEGIEKNAAVGEDQIVKYRGNNVRVRVVYLGEMSLNEILDDYSNGILYKETKDLLYKINNKSDEDKKPRHVFQVQIKSQIKSTKTGTFLKSFTGTNDINRVINNGAVAIITDTKIELQPKRDVVSVGRGKDLRLFKLATTEPLTLKQYVRSIGEEKALSNLGFRSAKSLRNEVANNGNSFVYDLNFYDARESFVNTRQEINSVGEMGKPFLQDLTLITSHRSETFENLTSKFELKHENMSSTIVSLNDLNDLKGKLSTLNDEEIKEKEQFLKGLISSDMTVMFIDVANQTVEKGLKDLERKLHVYLTSKDISLKQFKENIKDIHQLKGELLSIFSNKLKLENTISKLQSHYDANIKNDKDSFVSYSNNFEYKAATKYDKPLFVYNIAHDQWMQYDRSTNNLIETRIPLFNSNRVLVVGQERLMKKSRQREIISSILTKNNNFRELSDNNITDFSLHSELAILGVGIDESINEPVNSFDLSVDSIDNVYSVMTNTAQHYTFNQVNFQDVKSANGNNTPALQVDGEVYLASDFGEATNLVINDYADGARKITVFTKKDSYDLILMDEQLSKQYVDFTGNKVFDKFKVRVGDEYFIFTNAHRVDNILSFELRNKLIEEKIKVKSLGAITKQMFIDQLKPMSNEIRFPKNPSPKQFNRFAGVESYNDFIRWMKSDFFDSILTDEEKILGKELLKLDAIYKEKQSEIKDYISDIRKENSNNLVVKNTEESFSEKSIVNDDVFVMLTDGPSFDKNYAYSKVSKLGLSVNPGFMGYDKANKVFYLSLFDDSKVSLNKKLATSFSTLIDAAQTELESAKIKTKDGDKIEPKKFIIDFPFDSIGDLMLGKNTGYDVAVAIARSITLLKNTKQWPSNLVIHSKLAAIINNIDGFTNLTNINKLRAFEVSSKYSEYAYNINNSLILDAQMTPGTKRTVQETWNEWIDSDNINNKNLYEELGSNSIVNKYYNGDRRTAFKALIKQWALANPKSINSIAARIGRKVIYDPYNSNPFSIATALSEILTEKFVDNSWMSFESKIIDNQDIADGQLFIALNKNEINFYEGKSLIMNNGKQYLVEIVNENFPIIKDISDDLKQKLMVSNTFELPDFTKKESFILASLSPLQENIKETFPFESGQINSILEQRKNITVSEEHKDIFSDATNILPIDHLANIYENSKNRFNATPYITDIISGLNDNIDLKYNESSIIAVIGSRLEDRLFTVDSIQNTLVNGAGSYVKFVDAGINAGSTFKIGHETGIESQVTAYILNSGKYIREGLYLKPVKSIVRSGENTIKVVINADKLHIRYNPNNDIQRGQRFSGMLEVDSNRSNKKKTDLVSFIIKDEEVLNFSDRATDFKNLILNNRTIGNSNENENLMEKFSEPLIYKDKIFIQSLLKIYLLTNDVENLIEINSISDLNKVFDSSEELQEEYEKLENIMFNFFDEGRLNLTIRNREILLNYLRNNFPNIINKVNPIYLDLLGKDRYMFEYSDEYLTFLRQYNLTESAFDSFKDFTFEDVYNTFISTGDRIFLRNGVLEGQIAANIISKSYTNVKAFKSGDKYFVLDYDRVYSNGNPNEFDAKINKESLETSYTNIIEKNLANRSEFKKIFEFAKNYKLFIPDVYSNNKLKFIFDDVVTTVELPENSSISNTEDVLSNFSTMVKEKLYTKIKSLYTDNIKRIEGNTTLAESANKESVSDLIPAGTIIASTHVGAGRSLDGNPWIFTFRNNRKTEVIDKDSLNITDYIAGKKDKDNNKKNIDVSRIFQLGDNDKTKVRFSPIKLEQEGVFFVVNIGSNVNAHIVEFIGDKKQLITIESFSDETKFNKIAVINIHSDLQEYDALDKSPTYYSKDGNVFSYLYTGLNEDSKIMGPFTIEREPLQTVAVKMSKADPSIVDSKYVISFEDKSNIMGQRSIWTSIITDASEVNSPIRSSNIDVTEGLPSQEDVDKTQKGCE